MPTSPSRYATTAICTSSSAAPCCCSWDSAACRSVSTSEAPVISLRMRYSMNMRSASTRRPFGLPTRSFAAAVIEQGQRHSYSEHATGFASRQLVRSFHATKQIRGREPCFSSRVAFECGALTKLLKGTKLCATGRRSGKQRLKGDRRLRGDLGGRNCGEQSVTRQHAGDRCARFGKCDRRGRHDLIGVAEFLFCAQPIESRAFAFSLTGAKDIDEPFDLAHVGSKGLEAFLLGDDASDRCGGIGAEQPEPPVALSLCRGSRRNAGSR